MVDDSLTDFHCRQFTDGGTTHGVFRSGSGPAVVIMAEIPGITPNVARFARTVRDQGMTAVMPDMFGVAGRDPNLPAHGPVGTVSYGARTVGQLCISREFTLFATGRTSPIVAWLRALAAHEHRQQGGPGVGVVGMCLTGGFALAMAADDTVIAPVLSQPSLPLPVTQRRKTAIDVSDADMRAVQHRCAAGLKILGLRFRSDRYVPDERFAHLRKTLGDAFLAVELDDRDANPRALLAPHSVLTEHLIDRPGEPTRHALDMVLDHLRSHLLPDNDGDSEPG
ncbi:dienelactone hydrolase family protein [Gordonia sp. (in: high G+C Gram-positive bacteria)]|uniref:dienelactone hydrolase family protein n=1 Tax=Gordonia sp. (in: high G+C Gram-positive bacteria) TaxID=84139 RepID=UPI003F9686CA